METYFGVEGMSIKGSYGRYGVFVKESAVSWHGQYDDAAKLLQDVYISKKASDDDMIGTVKFCPSEVGNGILAVVVAKVEDGYLIQPVNSNDQSRFTVTADLLSEPPTQVN